MLELTHRDGRPIYQQVKDDIRRLIVSGALSPDSQLPSIRAMASSLAINPNTIQRAYDALTEEGYLRSVPGKGCFVTPCHHIDRHRRDQLLVQFDTIVDELRFLCVPPEALTQRITQRGDCPL